MAALTETLVLVTAIVCAWMLRGWIQKLRRPILQFVADSPGLAIVLAGVVGSGASVAVGLWQGIPIPGTHDEFSYLLAADTYARGRLTNPPDPCWEHFENMHIIQQPSYMSKFPPGQGLVLALGQVLCGLPIAGVWLSVGLAAAAVCWMLRAFVPTGWACLGGICLGLHVSIDYWAQSYWGGTAAAVGGALLFGAAARLVKMPEWRNGLVLGTGIALLALTRPYEGMMATVAAAVMIRAATWRRSQRPLAANAAQEAAVSRASLLECALAVAAVIVPAGLWQAHNNTVVTGKWWQLPYQAHDATYVASPTFLWQAEIPIPEYRHRDMRDYYVGWERERFLRKRAGFGFNGSTATKAWIFLRFFVGALLAIPAALAVWRFRAGGVRPAVLALLLALLAATQTLYLHPHYLAPFGGFVYLLAAQGWRTLRGYGTFGPALSKAVCLAAVVAPPLVAVLHPHHRGTRRNEIQSSLLSHPGNHLVFVLPGEDYDCHECWAYNLADPATARIVWARSINPPADARLMERFSDRSVWRLKVDRSRCELSRVNLEEQHMTPGTRPVRLSARDHAAAATTAN